MLNDVLGKGDSLLTLLLVFFLLGFPLYLGLDPAIFLLIFDLDFPVIHQLHLQIQLLNFRL
ncbi:hypothetical protein D3C77_430380 [compost metagenome]